MYLQSAGESVSLTTRSESHEIPPDLEEKISEAELRVILELFFLDFAGQVSKENYQLQ